MENKPDLSPRQVEVLADVAVGYTNREIGDHLGLSQDTVKFRLWSICDKLGVSTRAELALLAAQWLRGPGDPDT